MQANCTTFTEPLHKHRKTSQLQWQKDAGKLYYLGDDCTKRQQICENLIISYTEQLVYKQAWIHHKVFRQDAMESGRLAHTKEQNASGGKALPMRVKSFSSPLWMCLTRRASDQRRLCLLEVGMSLVKRQLDGPQPCIVPQIGVVYELMLGERARETWKSHLRNL